MVVLLSSKLAFGLKVDENSSLKFGQSMQQTTINRETIIAEYLTGYHSYPQLEAKYGIDVRKIHYWVSGYKAKIKNCQLVSEQDIFLCMKYLL